MAKESVIEVLRSLNGGEALEDLRNAIDQVSTSVIERGGQGKVTLELSVSKNGDRGVLVVDTVKTTLPKKKSAQTSFFVARDGGLSRKDPDQFEMKVSEEVNY